MPSVVAYARFLQTIANTLCITVLPLLVMVCGISVVWPAATAAAIPMGLMASGSRPEHWVLPGVVNLSGVTWQANADRLWLVLNNPTVLLVLDDHGQVARTVWLKGFEDTEGITWLYGNTFAVVEERRCTVAIIDVADEAARVHYQHAQVWHIPNGCRKNNQGLEAVAYDAANDRLYIGQESSPRQIWVIQGVSQDHGPQAAHVLAGDAQLYAAGADIAGLHIVPGGEQVLVLSEASRRMSTLSQGGDIIGRKSLPKRRGSRGPLLQPEGLAQDGQGRLYIVSEPNIVARYSSLD